MAIFENQNFMLILWGAIFLVALIVEILTTELVSVWFCGGALISFITAIFKVPFWVQAVVFVVISAILLVWGRVYWAKKLSQKSSKTNYDALIGEKILITEDVSERKSGAGKYRDVTWTVISDQEIAAGSYAVVKEIKGNKLIVEKKED